MKKVASPALVRADEKWCIVTLAKLEASITAPHKPPHKRGKLAGPHFARNRSSWHSWRVDGSHLASDYRELPNRPSEIAACRVRKAPLLFRCFRDQSAGGHPRCEPITAWLRSQR